jgi:hypothetical protein
LARKWAFSFAEICPDHALIGTALSHDGPPAVVSPGSVRFSFTPGRGAEGLQLRHAVLQTLEGLLLPKSG